MAVIGKPCSWLGRISVQAMATAPQNRIGSPMIHRKPMFSRPKRVCSSRKISALMTRICNSAEAPNCRIARIGQTILCSRAPAMTRASRKYAPIRLANTIAIEAVAFGKAG